LLRLRSNQWPYRHRPILNRSNGGFKMGTHFTWTSFRTVTGGLYRTSVHVHRTSADMRLLAIPPSYFRVAESNLNWEKVSGLASVLICGSHCPFLCSTCVAQPIRVMMTWRVPLLHFLRCKS